MNNKEYGCLRLPKTLIEEMRLWKEAYQNSYRAPVTYEFMLRGMLDSLETTEPGVKKEFEKLVESTPSIIKTIKYY